MHKNVSTQLSIFKENGHNLEIIWSMFLFYFFYIKNLVKTTPIIIRQCACWFSTLEKCVWNWREKYQIRQTELFQEKNVPVHITEWIEKKTDVLMILVFCKQENITKKFKKKRIVLELRTVVSTRNQFNNCKSK